MNTCGTCGNWSATDGSNRIGLCRGGLPSTSGAVRGPIITGYWPTTSAGSWCRQWTDEPGGPPAHVVASTSIEPPKS